METAHFGVVYRWMEARNCVKFVGRIYTTDTGDTNNQPVQLSELVYPYKFMKCTLNALQ